METDATDPERKCRMAETNEEAMSELTTSGTVVGHKTRSSGGNNRLLYPVVRFETQEGSTVEFESRTGGNTPPRVGEEVTVVYDPLRPEEAGLTLGSTIRFRPQTFVIVGVLALGIVAFFFLALLVMVLLVLL